MIYLVQLSGSYMAGINLSDKRRGYRILLFAKRRQALAKPGQTANIPISNQSAGLPATGGMAGFQYSTYKDHHSIIPTVQAQSCPPAGEVYSLK